MTIPTRSGQNTDKPHYPTDRHLADRGGLEPTGSIKTALHRPAGPTSGGVSRARTGAGIGSRRQRRHTDHRRCGCVVLIAHCEAVGVDRDRLVSAGIDSFR